MRAGIPWWSPRGSSPRLARSARRLRLLLSGLAALLLTLAPLAAQPKAAPAPAPSLRTLQEPGTCVMGVYLQDLRDFKFAERSLFASLRLWSVCPTALESPLRDLTVHNSNDAVIGDVKSRRMINNSGYFPNVRIVHWSEATVSGTFFHHWSSKNFPFDRHQVVFEFETGKDDVSQFVLTPDYSHSGYNPEIGSREWIVSDFTLSETEHRYATNFGRPDPEEAGRGTYSRILVSVTLRRAKVTSFIKLCTGVYAAVIIAGMAFLMDMREPDIVSGRTGLLVGCLFAAIVNMQQAEATLGLSEDVTLTDKIHIISIIYILASSMQAMVSYLRCEAGYADLAQRIDRRICLPVYLSSFVVINLVVIAYSAIIG